MTKIINKILMEKYEEEKLVPTSNTVIESKIDKLLNLIPTLFSKGQTVEPIFIDELEVPDMDFSNLGIIENTKEESNNVFDIMSLSIE